MSTEPTNLRLDVEAKKNAYAIFEQVGLKPAQAINLFLQQVALRGGLPFEVKVPNVETMEAIEELANGGGESAETSDQFYKELGV